MQEQFIKLLRTDTPLAELLEKRKTVVRPLIDWIVRPDTDALPAITLTTVDDLDDLNQEQPTNLVATRVQMDFWGADNAAFGGGYAQVRKAYRRVKEKFQPKDGVYPRFIVDGVLFAQVVYDNSRDLPQEDLQGGQRVFHLEADFIVWHRKITS